MKYIKREKCIITGANDLEHLYTFKNFPIFMGTTKDDISNDIYADMSWLISKSSGLIQLENLLPLDVIYKESHGSGVVGELWNKHHQSLADFISRYDPTSILEIGGSHGKIANEYHKIKNAPWTILDPNPDPMIGTKVNYIKGFFDENFKCSDSFDMVIHSHLFEHIYDPNIFMNQLCTIIENGKYLIFSIPNLELMMQKKQTNTINFEHTILLTEPYVEHLLSKYGFRVTEKKYFRDHSIFYAAEKDNTVLLQELSGDLYKKNKYYYDGYITYHRDIISEMNYKMRDVQNDIYLFGAHIFAQYLIAFGLNTKHIISILDNDTNKQNKRLYGTSLFVNSPKILKNKNSPIVILKAGVFNDEIKNDILNNINSNTIFWE